MDRQELDRRRAEQFYSMMGLLKCAEVYYQDLLSTGGITVPGVKNRLADMFKEFRQAQTNFIKVMDEEQRKQWHADWSRDILSMSSVVETMSGMSDEQRNIVEMFAKEVLKGNVKMELDTNQ